MRFPLARALFDVVHGDHPAGGIVRSTGRPIRRSRLRTAIAPQQSRLVSQKLFSTATKFHGSVADAP